MNYSASYDIERDGPVPLIISLVLALIYIIALWRVFSKAGKPGILAIVPIFNLYTLARIGGKGIGWTIASFIPVLNIVAAIVIALGVAKNFGKSGVFGFFGLVIFSFIGYLILAFGKAEYTGAYKES